MYLRRINAQNVLKGGFRSLHVEHCTKRWNLWVNDGEQLNLMLQCINAGELHVEALSVLLLRLMHCRVHVIACIAYIYLLLLNECVMFVFE